MSICLLLSLCAAAWHASADLTNGLVANFAFDGSASDSSGHGNEPVVGGVHNISYTTNRFGQFNSAASFNGSTSWIDYGDNAALSFPTNSFSVSLWINATVNDYYVIGKTDRQTQWRNWSIQCEDTPEDGIGVRFNFSDSTNSLPDAVTTGTDVFDGWHHVCMVVDREQQTVSAYLDGAFRTNYSIADYGNIANTNTVKIGRRSDDWGYLEGQLDDIRIYSRALTGAEVVDLFLLPPPPGPDVSVADFEGTWRYHGLISGDEPDQTPGWYRGTHTINSAGIVTTSSPVFDSLGNSNWVPTLPPISIAADGTTIITSNGVSLCGVLNGSKDSMVMVGTMHPGSDSSVGGFNMLIWTRNMHFKVDPRLFPTSNTVRLTLEGASTNFAYSIHSTPALGPSATWTPIATGAVGQLSFDIVSTTNRSMFYRATLKTSSFEQQDLAGTWHYHGLVSGDHPNQTPGWYHGTYTVNSAGVVTASSPVFDSLGNSNWVPTLPPISIAADGTTLITSNGVSIYGVLNGNKDSMVMVGTMHPGSDSAVGGFNLLIWTRQTVTNFMSADLAGNWRYHGLISGDQPDQTPGWYRGTHMVNSAGVVTASSPVLDSLGNSDWTPTLPPISIASDGTTLITSNGVSIYGVMNGNKDSMVMVGTMYPGSDSAVGGYNLMIWTKQSK